MENVASSVRIAGDAINVLSRLSHQLGQSKAKVIERALAELEERIFWEEVSQAFERMAADPAATAQVKAEAEFWENGAARDLAGEEW